jgi:hypothetical protein
MVKVTDESLDAGADEDDARETIRRLLTVVGVPRCDAMVARRRVNMRSGKAGY